MDYKVYQGDELSTYDRHAFVRYPVHVIRTTHYNTRLNTATVGGRRSRGVRTISRGFDTCFGARCSSGRINHNCIIHGRVRVFTYRRVYNNNNNNDIFKCIS